MIAGDDDKLSTGEQSLILFQINCMLSKLEKADEAKCLMSCPKPCMERVYSTSTSASGPWPHPSFELSLYENFIRKTPALDEHFNEYGSILDDLQYNRITAVSRTAGENSTPTAEQLANLL